MCRPSPHPVPAMRGANPDKLLPGGPRPNDYLQGQSQTPWHLRDAVLALHLPGPLLPQKFAWPATHIPKGSCWDVPLSARPSLKTPFKIAPASPSLSPPRRQCAYLLPPVSFGYSVLSPACM